MSRPRRAGGDRQQGALRAAASVRFDSEEQVDQFVRVATLSPSRRAYTNDVCKNQTTPCL